MLEIAVSENGSARQLRLTGELDLAGVDRFERLLTTDQTPGSPRSSSTCGNSPSSTPGLRALIMADHRVRAEGGRFIVVRGPDRVNEVLEMTGSRSESSSSTSLRRASRPSAGVGAKRIEVPLQPYRGPPSVAIDPQRSASCSVKKSPSRPALGGALGDTGLEPSRIAYLDAKHAI